jgi:hypothetical protein
MKHESFSSVLFRIIQGRYYTLVGKSRLGAS